MKRAKLLSTIQLSGHDRKTEIKMALPFLRANLY